MTLIEALLTFVFLKRCSTFQSVLLLILSYFRVGMVKNGMNSVPLHWDHEENSFFSPPMEEKKLDMHTEHDSTLRPYAHRMLEHMPIGMALFDACDLRLLAANTWYH